MIGVRSISVAIDLIGEKKCQQQPVFVHCCGACAKIHNWIRWGFVRVPMYV